MPFTRSQAHKPLPLFPEAFNLQPSAHLLPALLFSLAYKLTPTRRPRDGICYNLKATGETTRLLSLILMLARPLTFYFLT